MFVSMCFAGCMLSRLTGGKRVCEEYAEFKLIVWLGIGCSVWNV